MEDDLLNTRLTRSSLQDLKIFRFVAIENFGSSPSEEVPGLKMEEMLDSKSQLHEQKDLEPDEHDPNLYCKCCKRTYSRRSNYKRHLKKVHDIMVTPISKILHPELLPDILDANFYCRGCDKSFYNKYTYRTHLQRIHQLLIAPLTTTMVKNQEESSDGRNSTTYCNYNRHLLVTSIHNIQPTFEKNNDGIYEEEDSCIGYCGQCKILLPGQNSYCNHLIKVHKMQATFNPHKPDDIDPERYCISCKRLFYDKYKYRRHLQRVHKITLAPLPNTINSLIVQDINDPNLHCSLCDKQFASKYNFHRHLRKIHRMAITTQSDSDDLKPLPVVINQPPNLYCKPCKKKLSSKYHHDAHLRSNSHKSRSIAWKNRVVVNTPTNSLITLKDDLDTKSNTYCEICGRQFHNVNNYRSHLSNIHNMKLIPLSFKPNPLPVILDENDPTFYCRLCKKAFSSRRNYQGHLRCVHKMKLAPLAHTPNPIIVPDENDPNFYCKSCEKTLSNAWHYRGHLRRIHKMTSAQQAKIFPEEIAVADLDRYCKSCKKLYYGKYSYRNHLKDVHKETFALLQNTPDLLIVPDENDPNFYYKSCKKTLPNA